MKELKNVSNIERLIEVLLIMNENFCNIEYLYYDDQSEKEENEEKSMQDENDDEVYYTLGKKNNKNKPSSSIEIEENLCIKKINCIYLLGFYNYS